MFLITTLLALRVRLESIDNNSDNSCTDILIPLTYSQLTIRTRSCKRYYLPLFLSFLFFHFLRPSSLVRFHHSTPLIYASRISL